MNHTQFCERLSQYALFESDVADNKLRGRDAKAEMLRHAAHMTPEQKADADSRAIGTIEARLHVKAKVAEKQARYSGYNFEHNTAAHKALARARLLLAPTNSEEAEAAVAKLFAVHSNKVDKVTAMLRAYDKLSAGEKRSFLAQAPKKRG